MCGRYFLDDTEEANERLLNLLRGLLESGDPLASQVHTGEIFPTQLAPVIVADGGRVTVRAMRWGFPRGGGRGVVINSRSEKADHTPMFQRAVRSAAAWCRYPAFTNGGVTPSGGKTKDKYAFRSQGGVEKGLMYLAGVYGEFLGGFRAGGFDGFAIPDTGGRRADAALSRPHARHSGRRVRKKAVAAGSAANSLRRPAPLLRPAAPVCASGAICRGRAVAGSGM